MAAQASVSGPAEVSPLSGLGLIEDGQDLNEAMESNSWVAESLAAFGTAMDVQQLVSDPLQTLMSWGISWLLDHMSPLKDWLNELAGNPGEVQGFAATWTSIGESLQTNSADLAGAVAGDLEGQEGMGIAAYSALQTDIAKHVELAGTCSNAMSTALGVASTIVQVVHDLVRDAIADIVAAIAAKAVELAISCGTLAPKIVADIASLALEWAGKLRRYVDDLLSSGKRLSKLSDDLSGLFTRLKDAMANIKGGAVSDAIKQSDDVASSTSHALPGGSKGIETPPKPDPINPGGSVERRWPYNGGPDGNGSYVDYHLDSKGNVTMTEGVFDEDNIVNARRDTTPGDVNHHHRGGLSRLDADDRSAFRDAHGLKGTTDDAGHMANVQVMPPTRARLLDEQFPFDDAYGGRHAAAQEPLATMRQNLADPNHPAQTWSSAFEELSPRDQKLVKDLEDQENGLNFAAQDRSLNRGSFRTQFEGPTLDASGPRQFSVEQVGHNAGGRPSGFNVSSSTIGTNGSTSTIVPPTFFPN